MHITFMISRNQEKLFSPHVTKSIHGKVVSSAKYLNRKDKLAVGGVYFRIFLLSF